MKRTVTPCPMKNPYKRLDVFKCDQEAHRHFGGHVSVFHVLKEKGCFPQGCLYFVWHCARLEKGKRCVQGYNWTGKNCKGCTHFLEDKVHLQPQCLLDDRAYAAFLEEVDDFNAWWDSIQFKRRAVAGCISAVKPWFVECIDVHRSQRRLQGYILVFQKGFFGVTPFEDAFFVRAGERQMRTHAFVPGMQVELQGELRMDRGRVVVAFPKSIEAEGGEDELPWKRDSALVAMKTATLQEGQPEPCHACRWGVLVDVEDTRSGERIRFRRLYCLKSMPDPESCYVKMWERLSLQAKI